MPDVPSPEAALDAAIAPPPAPPAPEPVLEPAAAEPAPADAVDAATETPESGGSDTRSDEIG
jgi:hypothetical protein